MHESKGHCYSFFANFITGTLFLCKTSYIVAYLKIHLWASFDKRHTSNGATMWWLSRGLYNMIQWRPVDVRPCSLGSISYRGFSCDVISSQFCKSSYNTIDRHDGFLSLQASMGKCKTKPKTKTKQNKRKQTHKQKNAQNFLFSSYHNTKLQPSDKNISTHTRLNYLILLKSESKITACFVHVFHCAAQYEKETRERGKIERMYWCMCNSLLFFTLQYASWLRMYKWQPLIHSLRDMQKWLNGWTVLSCLVSLSLA